MNMHLLHSFWNWALVLPSGMAAMAYLLDAPQADLFKAVWFYLSGLCIGWIIRGSKGKAKWTEPSLASQRPH